jgi:hypothetical protein
VKKRGTLDVTPERSRKAAAYTLGERSIAATYRRGFE